jgi:hypothetical protein
MLSYAQFDRYKKRRKNIAHIDERTKKASLLQGALPAK